MSYASIANPVFPTIEIPVKAINAAAALAIQSVGVAATLWLLLAAPGFLTDHTALAPPASAAAAR